MGDVGLRKTFTKNELPHDWALVPLKEISENHDGMRIPLKSTDRKARQGTIPYYGASGIIDYIDDFIFDGNYLLIAEDGANLVARSTPVAFPALGKFWVNNHAHVITPKPCTTIKYLTRFFEIFDLSSFITGSAQPKLNQKNLNRIMVPLPPLAEQKRIAAILDKADMLRTKRRAALAKLDSLVQSVFLEMFGDPVTNPMGWEEYELFETAEKFSDGPFGSNLKSEHYVERGIRVIRLQNIGVGYLNNNDLAFISQEHFNSLPRHHCVPGDVVIGTLGDPNLRACIVPRSLERCLNKADCVQYRVNASIMGSVYACWLLNNPRTVMKAEKLSLGQTRLRISMGRLKTLVIPVPPLDKQLEFGKVVTKINKFQHQHQQSTIESDNLFHALQQRAFRGEL